MFCKYCGANCPDGAEFCATCGKKLNEAPAEAPVNEAYTQVLYEAPANNAYQQPTYEAPVNNEGYQQPVYEAPVYQAPEEPKKDGKGLGIASFILSLVSLVCCCGNLPFSIAGLIMGIVSNKKNKNGLATAGVVLGIIGIVLFVLALIGNIIYYAIYGVSALALIGAESAVAADPYYYY